jgi:glutathionylspermidine synthase
MTEAKSLNYLEFAQELYNTGIISDPWIEGKERFRTEPFILSSDLYKKLYTASEEIGKLYEEFCEMIWKKPELLDDFFYLTPYEKFLWLSSKGEWHGIARMDLFVLSDGSIRFCEMNSDTPSGEAEAVLLNKICHPLLPDSIDPNVNFADKFCSMISQLYQSAGKDDPNPTIGIVYPTEMPEDLSMISIYQEWMEERGFNVVLGSPFNIQRLTDGSIGLFDKKIDIMFRHYKTDWWCERLPVWTDQSDYPDPDPLDAQLQNIVDSEVNNRLVIVNPLGAVLTQNKFSMAFFWERTELFSKESRETIQKYIPETFRLLDMDKNSLNREDWVLKSDYGCEGDEVIIGRFVSDDIWKESLEKAIPERWIVQKFFDASPDENNYIPNYGIYLICGEASGAYLRLSPKATDYRAVTVPVFVDGK